MSQFIKYSNIIDCTQLLTDKCVNWPGGIGFSIKPCCTYFNDGCCTNEIITELGIGTHVDSPMHFIQGGRSISDLTPNELIANLVLIDVEPKCTLNPNYILTIEDVQNWEIENGIIPPRSLVCMRTGFGRKFIDPIEYRNTYINNEMNFPGFGIDCAKYLLTKNIVGVGIDTLSIDAGLSTKFEAHFEFLGNNVYQVENLLLDNLNPNGDTIIISPLKILNAPESPARVFVLKK